MSERRNFYRPAIVYAIGLFTLVAAILAVHALTAPPEPPSVVVVVVDSLRADRMGVYGHSRDTTPNIDAMARQGVVFDHAYTVETLSGPAISSGMTSVYPVTHGVRYNGYRLDPAIPTLAEVLRARGFATAGFVSHPIVGRGPGLDRGFDEFVVSRVANFPDHTRRRADETRSAQLATTWLQQHRGERFFLFLHLQQPHWSYDPVPPYDTRFAPVPADFPYRDQAALREGLRAGAVTADDERFVEALYDGEIAFVDHMLGWIFAELERHPQPFLLILLADHGDLLFEPAQDKRVGHGAGRYYEGAWRIPLIVVPPRGLERGVERVDALVSSVDVMPTVLEWTHVPPSTVEGLEGRSLTPLIAGTEQPGRDAVYAMYLKHDDSRTLAIRTERFKLIHRPDAPEADQLFDLSTDPAERNDLRLTQRETARELRRRLAAWFDERPAERTGGGVRTLSPAVEEMLRRAGYLEPDED